MSLCSIPLDSHDLPQNIKIPKPVLAPQVKNNDDHKNSCKLKIRMCVNGKEDAKLKSLKKHSSTCLEDRLRFTIGVSTFFNLWMSVSDIVNFFQNTMINMDNKMFMTLPPCYREWFQSRYPHIPLLQYPGKLIVRLFDVCQ